MEWKHTHSSVKKKFKAEGSVKKVVLTASWNTKEPISTDFLEKHAAASESPYCQFQRQYFLLFMLFFVKYFSLLRSLYVNFITNPKVKSWILYDSFLFFSFFCFKPQSTDSSCRTRRLHFGSGVRHSQWVFWIWHHIIWWWGASKAGALGNVDYLFIALAPRSTLIQSGSTYL